MSAVVVWLLACCLAVSLTGAATVHTAPDPMGDIVSSVKQVVDTFSSVPKAVLQPLISNITPQQKKPQPTQMPAQPESPKPTKAEEKATMQQQKQVEAQHTPNPIVQTNQNALLAPPPPPTSIAAATMAIKSSEVQRISVCVPAIPRDVPVLPRLLRSISEQTQKPHEVVVALSESTQQAGDQLQLELSKIFSPVSVVTTPKKQFPMENRMMAANRATGDVLSFMDADDEMHPQRIEITANVMREEGAACVIHSLVFNPKDAAKLRFDWHKAYIARAPKLVSDTAAHDKTLGNRTPVAPKTNGDLALIAEGLAFDGHIAAQGHPTIRRDVALRVPQIHQQRAEDCLFLRHVLDILGTHDSSLVYVDLPLTYYHPSDHPDNEWTKDMQMATQMDTSADTECSCGPPHSEWKFDPAPVISQ